MWECPKCGRMFKNKNQDHYCGEAPKTIEEYISRQPEAAQSYLQEINRAIKTAIPDAAEKISWSIRQAKAPYNFLMTNSCRLS